MTAHDSQAKVVASDDTMDAGMRRWAYRQRRKRAVTEAIGNEAAASRATLLTLLAHGLAALDSRSTPDNMIGPSRNGARRVLNEIIARYDIEL